MTADVELLPCPFCGTGESVVSLWFDDVSNRFRVGCGRCGCSTGTHPRDKTETPAITAWNTRANVAHATAAKDAEISELVNDRDDLLARLDASIDHGTKLGAAMQRCLDEVLEQRAEIEALRAEVERWKSLHATAYDAFRTGVATERRLEARAERLAEALRYAEAFISVSMPQLARDRDEAVNEVLPAIRAALHPTAAQEGE